MGILRKFLSIWIYSASAVFAMVVIAAIMGIEEHPGPDWGAAILAAIFSFVFFVLGQKVWPKTQVNETFNLHYNHSEVSVDSLVAGGKYLMVYTDARGARSERIIQFIRITVSKGNAYIRAVCLTKNANCTFPVDRIESLFSMDSDDVLV